MYIYIDLDVNVLCYICRCVIVSLYMCIYVSLQRSLYSPVDQCVHVLLNKYVLHQWSFEFLTCEDVTLDHNLHNFETYIFTKFGVS